MKIIYAGTPDFAVPALQAIIDAGFEVVQVLTQPDRPAGRGMKLQASPVKQLALKHQLNVFQPENLKPNEVQAEIAKQDADAMVVAAYGLMIPTPVLHMPRLGAYNIHASLLPRWRGAAPIHRAVQAGDSETGVTIMQVVPALDAGDMVLKLAVPITPHDTTQTLHDALANLGAHGMVQVLRRLARGEVLAAETQDETLVTYAHKIQKSEAEIDWNQPAEKVSRHIRAFNPFPGAVSSLGGQACKLWMSTVVDGQGQAGEIIGLHNGIQVACGQGAITIETLQIAGGRRLSATEFLRGHPVKIGERFSHLPSALSA